MKEFKPNLFQRFFWFCSGVDTELLTGKNEHFPSPIKSEFNKYIGIGTAVFFTALFATFSASFAVSFLNISLLACIFIGLLWGINIFFLDRYIVSSMRKKDSIGLEVLQALPRLLIGTIFAFTIAVPIELKLFEGKVNMELMKTNNDFANNCKEECDQQFAELNKAILPMDKTYEEKKKTTPNGYQELKDQQSSLNKKNYDLSKSITKNYGIIRDNRSSNAAYPENSADKYIYNDQGKRYLSANRELLRQRKNYSSELSKIDRLIQEKFALHEKELSDLKTQIEKQKAPLLAEIHRLEKECPERIANCKTTSENSTDLLARYEALNRAEGDMFSSMWWASKLIFALFLFLELAPVLSKLLSSKGPYDFRLEKINELEQIHWEEINLRVQLDRQIQDFHKQDMEMKMAHKTQLLRNQQINDIDILQTKLKTELKTEQDKQNIILDKHNMENEREKKQAEYMHHQRIESLLKRLEEAKTMFQLDIDQIKHTGAQEAKLNQDIAKHISDRQFEILKGDVDRYFDGYSGNGLNAN